MVMHYILDSAAHRPAGKHDRLFVCLERLEIPSRWLAVSGCDL